MAEFAMPQLGESDVEGTVLRWLKQAGEHVRADEPLVEVETEKVNVEIPSPFDGTLTRILVPEGETVPVGAILAEIDPVGDGATARPAADLQPASATPGRPPARAADAETPAATPPPPSPAGTPVVHRNGAAAHGEEARGPSGPGPGRYSPAVLRLAAEHHLDLSRIAGTGMDGRVTRKDVMRFIESGAAAGSAAAASPPPAPGASEMTAAAPVPVPAPAPARPPMPAPPAGDDEEIIRPSATRLTIARNMTRSAQTIPVAWMVVEVDVTGLVRLRAAAKEPFRAREGVDLTYLPFVIAAVSGALKEHPFLNAQWRDEDIVLKKRVNIGVAVGSDDGLVVPVIHDADRLSLAGLAHAIADLSARARTRRLRLEDVQGGTFTVDNTGVFGSVVSQPIINPPQCAILSTEAVTARPVVVDDAIAIRSLMNLCISFDHRIVDGTQVGPFMQAVKRRLESYTPASAIA